MDRNERVVTRVGRGLASWVIDFLSYLLMIGGALFLPLSTDHDEGLRL